MNRLLIVLAILAGKITMFFSRMTGNQGSNLPGIIARKICPGILRYLAGNVTGSIVVITGTNGKTTTSNMAAEILKEKGYNPVHNRAGANMLAGITAAFIEKADFLGRRRFDFSILETDEATVPLLVKEVNPRFLLITNFFRDQLDRYGELDRTVTLIKEAVRDKDVELILNADDPLMVSFREEAGLKCWYYGFDDTVYDTFEGAESREGRYCVFCGGELEYRRYHYAQLGKFYCPQCGNCNPRPDFTAQRLEMTPEIKFQAGNITIKSSYQGFHNAYNMLAAVSLSKLLAIEDEVIEKAIASYEPQAGRMERFIIDGKKTVLVLVKNPTGLNQTLSTLANDPAGKNIFFALNDNAADGRDISWIWDADVEILNKPSAGIRGIVCSGLRSGDIAVRIKYCGFDINNMMIETDLKKGIEAAVKCEGEVNYILCTYTALFECQKILRRMEREKFPRTGRERQMQV